MPLHWHSLVSTKKTYGSKVRIFYKRQPNINQGLCQFSTFFAVTFETMLRDGFLFRLVIYAKIQRLF